jgi:hypothetical protein
MYQDTESCADGREAFYCDDSCADDREGFYYEDSCADGREGFYYEDSCADGREGFYYATPPAQAALTTPATRALIISTSPATRAPAKAAPPARKGQGSKSPRKVKAGKNTDACALNVPGYGKINGKCGCLPKNGIVHTACNMAGCPPSVKGFQQCVPNCPSHVDDKGQRIYKQVGADCKPAKENGPFEKSADGMNPSCKSGFTFSVNKCIKDDICGGASKDIKKAMKCCSPSSGVKLDRKTKIVTCNSKKSPGWTEGYAPTQMYYC